MKSISIILARGGSKGLPKKNILKINNKPLISYTIEASTKSKYINKTIVSSDCQEILNISKEAGVEIHKRSDELSGDKVSSELVLKNVLNSLLNVSKYDYLVLLQPTSPLRTEIHIDAAFKDIINSQATSLVSCKEVDNKFLKSFILDEKNYLKGVSNDEFPFMRRQDLPSLFMPNGAIYITKLAEFMNSHRLFSDKTIMFKMDQDSSVDVDRIEDLVLAEKLIKQKFT